MPVSEVYNMDCMDYLKQFPDNYFELAIVDPPYGINAPNMNMGSNPNRSRNDGHGSGPSISTSNKIRKGRLNSGSGHFKNRPLTKMNCNWDFEKPSPEYFEQLFRVSLNQIVWGGNYFDLPPTRGIGCWDKLQKWTNFSQWEMAWTSFDCPAWKVTISNTGGANQNQRIHPTQKPIKLYRYLLDKFAKPGDKILDTHLGSGSSRIAAYQMGFDFYGTELDPYYFTLMEKRFLKESAQLNLL